MILRCLNMDFYSHFWFASSRILCLTSSMSFERSLILYFVVVDRFADMHLCFFVNIKLPAFWR